MDMTGRSADLRSKELKMADIKDLNSYTFPNGQKLIDLEREKYDLFFTKGHSSISIVKGYSTEEEARMLEDSFKKVEQNYENYKKNSSQENKEQLFKSYIDYDVYTRFIVANHTKPNFIEIIKNQTGEYIYDKNVINYPEGYDDWLKKKNQELDKQIQQQNLKEQEKEEIITVQAAVASGLSYEEWEEMLNDNEIAEERIEQINGGVSEATLNKTDLEHIKRDFSYIRDIFETGDSISVKNEMVGLISIDKGNIGKSGNGLQHICTQRFEKDGRSVDEITAMLALVVNSAENGKVSRNNEIYQNEKDIGTYDIEKNGIIAFVSKTRDGNDEKFVITGFDDNSKKIEASDAINAVIAENSYAPDFVIVKEKVVATLASSYMLHLNEIESNLLNPKKDNIKRINKELKLLENYKNSDEIKRYFKNNNEDFDKVKKSIKKIDDLTNTSSEYQNIKKRINDLAVINTNEEVVINKTELNTELEEAKKTIQEKDKELDIWTAKAAAGDKEISKLNEQLEQKDKIIQKQDEALRKEQSIHNSSCDITVPQRDSNGNEIIGKDGKPLTSTLHCTEGIDAALGKLSRKCVDLTLENQRLQEELDRVNNRNSNSQSDNSWSD